MMASRLARVLEGRAIVAAACALSFAIGLFFLFVWAPHPWGREGFDHYHELALTVADGQSFPTMEVPWGYAYFLAAFYRVFGDRPVAPLLAQVALNAIVPAMVFVLARQWFDRRIAAVAAVLTGCFSFNTVYASTQSSDAVCTVLFMAALLAFARARVRSAPVRSAPLPRTTTNPAGSPWGWFALTGVLLGTVPQFRPNLILLPALLAAYLIAEASNRRRIAQAALMLVCAAAALMPWVARNYRLTGLVLPTSVHGGVQLWYGTLQVGPYLQSRAYNPRAMFESPAFEYTSLIDVPVVVRAHQKACATAPAHDVSLTYWTDRNRTPHTLAASEPNPGTVEFEIPAPHDAAAIYYYFETHAAAAGDVARTATAAPTPSLGADGPYVYFVSRDHLGDLDRHGDLLDVFDLIRLVRHEAWRSDLMFEEPLAASGVRSAAAAATLLLEDLGIHDTASATGVASGNDFAQLMLPDGASIRVPRQWSGRLTEIEFDGPAAVALMHANRRLSALQRSAPPLSHDELCSQVEDVSLNDVFYRREPHLMRRYSALAFDNIGREPLAFALAAAYRSIRLFIIQGSDDRATTHQFGGSPSIYRAATAASGTYFVMFVAGALLAWRRDYRFWLPLLLILYVPATISFVLTNMRYSVTVQPLVFMFVAVTITALAERAGLVQAHREERVPADTGRARLL
jgi:hypothetical protein